MRLCRVWVKTAEGAGETFEARGGLYTALYCAVLQARRVGDLEAARGYKGRADRLAAADPRIGDWFTPALTPEDHALVETTPGD
jgi:hypothetical protein